MAETVGWDDGESGKQKPTTTQLARAAHGRGTAQHTAKNEAMWLGGYCAGLSVVSGAGRVCQELWEL